MQSSKNNPRTSQIKAYYYMETTVLKGLLKIQELEVLQF
jgi:hypothetical protein